MPLVATPPQSYASTAEGVPCFSCADTAHVPSPAATGYRNRRTRESEVAGPGPVSARCRLSLRRAFEGKLLSRDRRCRQSDRTGEHSSRARAHFRGRAPAKRTCLHPVCRKAPVSCANLGLSPGTRCGTAWLRQQPGKETLLHPDGVERTAFAAAPAGQTLVVVEVRVVPHLNGVHRTD